MSDRLRIGLLQCGNVHADLIGRFGDFPAVYAELLEGHQIDLVTYDVQRSHLPSSPLDCDGWLVSGSAHSTYEPLPWIAPAERFLRRLVDAESPVVAICFGHQLLAQAMGGRVEHSPAGWGVGAHDYHLVDAPGDAGWPTQPVLRLIASHQDQVVELPDGASLAVRTEHCPNAGFTLGPRALALQPHPEFTAPLSRALTTLRRQRIGSDRAEAALASLDAPLDQLATATWMANTWRQ